MDNTPKAPKVLDTITLEIPLTEADLTDVLVTAMEGGIGYWCRKVELDAGSEAPDEDATHDPAGDRLEGEASSEWVARMLFAGGTVNFKVDCEYEQYWKPLTLQALIDGVRKWVALRASQGKLPGLYGGRLDTGDIDVIEADVILQYALLDDVVFG